MLSKYVASAADERARERRCWLSLGDLAQSVTLEGRTSLPRSGPMTLDPWGSRGDCHQPPNVGRCSDMRVMLRMQIPVEAGTQALRAGRIGPLMQDLMDRVKPEAAYFHVQNGMRGGSLVFDLESPALMPAIMEPLYQELNASVEVIPVMTVEDMQKALSDVQGEQSRGA
jgi:hypothetical protein